MTLLGSGPQPSAVEDQTCPEAQTYPIDLGKETVKNISVLRFGKRSKQFWNQLQQLQFSSPSDCYRPQALRFYWQSQAQPVGRAPLSTLQ